jgi:hypothetical protein
MKRMAKPALVALVLAVFSLLNACKTNVIEIPPPDFKKLMLETKTFSGERFTTNCTFDCLRNPILTVSDGATANELVFSFRDIIDNKPSAIEYTFKIVFAEKGRDAVTFTIPEQRSGSYSIVGAPIDPNDAKKTQGYYQAYDSQKNRIDDLSFAISISGVKWGFNLKKQ